MRLFASWLAVACFAGSVAGQVARVPDTKTGTPELDQLQRDVLKQVEQCQAATVGVRPLGYPGSGSGVIVSKDGLVLTAGHCIDKAGAPMEVILSNGRVLKAKALGAEWDLDIGMVQITEPGPWPHVALSKDPRPEPKEPCLAFGHPGGVLWDRKPVLRLGWITPGLLEKSEKNDGRERFMEVGSNCRLMPGDSGGPLFNLRGELIGIHCGIAAAMSSAGDADGSTGHASMGAFRKHWDFMLAGKSAGRNKAEAMFRGVKGKDGPKIEKGDKKVEDEKEGDKEGEPLTLEGLKKKWKLNDDVVKQLEGIQKQLPAKALPQVWQQIDKHLQGGGKIEELPPLKLELEVDEQDAQRMQQGGRVNKRSPRSPSEKVGEEARRVLQSTEVSVVEILKGKDKVRVGFGTVVGDGLVVAKSSELPEPAVCKFGDVTVEAAVVAKSEANDLALLKAELPGTKPITWSEDGEFGQVVVGQAGKAVELGVLALSPRRTPSAEQAIKEGLVNAADEQELKRRRQKLGGLNTLLGVTPSKRCDGFPWVFTHDLDLRADETGVPLVNLRGEAVGVHIACEGIATGLAVPARVVRNLLSQWEAAKKK